MTKQTQSMFLTIGLIAVASGLVAYYATGELGLFGKINLGFGVTALAMASLLALRNFEGFGASAARQILLRRLAVVVAVFLLCIGLERGATHLAWQWDWTADQRFELAPATLEILSQVESYSFLGELELIHFTHQGDPRARPTRLLLHTMAKAGPVRLHELDIAHAVDEAEAFEVSHSNSVAVQWGGRSITLDLPTEGAILAAIQLLTPREKRILYFAQGEGEGRLQAEQPSGYSILLQNLEREGYEVRPLITAGMSSVPDDAQALLLLGPRRNLEPKGLGAIEAYLEAGGRALFALEPGTESGVEALVDRFGGFQTPSDRILLDPSGAAIAGQPAGLTTLANSYTGHPLTKGLDRRTMTLFPSARPLYADRRPQPEDRLRPLVYTPSGTEISKELDRARRGLQPAPVPGLRPGREVIVAVGEYPREAGKARIALFGDADFASNAYIHSLYNLDLILNAVHWVAEREAEITLRPKLLNPYQEPLTPQDSLRLFYTFGLLLPELLLVAAAVTWLRSRSA